MQVDARWAQLVGACVRSHGSRQRERGGTRSIEAKYAHQRPIELGLFGRLAHHDGLPVGSLVSDTFTRGHLPAWLNDREPIFTTGVCPFTATMWCIGRRHSGGGAALFRGPVTGPSPERSYPAT